MLPFLTEYYFHRQTKERKSGCLSDDMQCMVTDLSQKAHSLKGNRTYRD